MNLAEKESMLMNWPERVWIYSPLRPYFQRREVREWLRVSPPKMLGSALEIGCGLGRGTRLATDLMGFQLVVAFDLEEILVQRSVRLRPADYRESVLFHVADAQDLPFADAAFDAVINFGIIHHVLDWRKCLREIARVLKKGGTFYFEEIYPPLYANPLFKLMLRHPRDDRFYGKDFLGMMSEVGLRLAPGVNTGSKFGIVGAAVKD